MRGKKWWGPFIESNKRPCHHRVCREHEQETDRSEALVGQHVTRRVHACENAAWLGYVDPKHEAGNFIQQITNVTLRATEVWTDGRHAVDDTYVELDCDLAVALAHVAEGAARSTVLKVTQVEPSHGFVAWQSAG